MIIGVFDSGFGGIDILRDLVREIPQADFLYLGDTARAPYGTRSKEKIYQFTKEGLRFLEKKGARKKLLACNTASSQALPLLEKRDKKLAENLSGIVEPVASYLASRDFQRIGVIGTEATIRSNAFKKEIKKKKPEVKVFQNPAPLLVPIVEEGEQDSKIAELAVKKYTTPLLKKNIEVLILGCTHFGILEKTIKKCLPQEVELIKEGPILAEKVKNSIQKKEGRGEVTFYTTDLTEKFTKLGSLFFGKRIKPIKVNL